MWRIQNGLMVGGRGRAVGRTGGSARDRPGERNGGRVRRPLGGAGDTAPDTAAGVLHGMRAACRFVFGSDDLSKRTVLVQGAGGVGGRLIELLMEADAAVIATDVDAKRLEALRERGLQTVAPDVALSTECDVLAPCAVGGVIHAR